MLVYHPAFDLYNCIYRMLILLDYSKKEKIELERMRIWDYYLTFPDETRKIVFPLELKSLKQIFKEKQKNPYENLDFSNKLIQKMEPYQLTALNNLASYGFIEKRDLLKKYVTKNKNKKIPKEVKSFQANLSIKKKNVLKLVVGFEEITNLDIKDLKRRTKLLEYKYD